MKTTNLKHQRGTVARRLLGSCSRAALLGSALLLGAAGLQAMPSVNTISGGPGAGFRDGNTAQTALFNNPVALALDSTETLLFVADRGNNAIRELDLGAGQTFTFATAGVNQPVGVAVDKSGDIFVLNHGDGSNGSIAEYDMFGDFLGYLATGLVNAQGMALDSVGNIYVTVQYNTVLQITSAGVQVTIAVIPTANTLLRGITIMDNGFLAVADFNNDGIYTIDPSNGDLSSNFSRLTGFNGAGDHFGPAAFAKFNQPFGVAAAGNNFLVVSDYGNNRVKVVDATGTVTNLYGVDSSFWVTGPGTFPGWFDGTVCRGDVNYNSFGCVESRLPSGVAFAADGTVYTTEDFYHLIRKVTSSGLPLHAPPPPPVPAPAVGWVDFTLPPGVVVSILRTNQPFVFHNDVKIAIAGVGGAEVHYEVGPTPVGVDTLPDPSATVGSTPPTYFDGMFPSQVPQTIAPPQPDLTVKAIGYAPQRTSSLVVSARFQFKVANPTVIGDNAALFSITDETANADLWYSTDGSDPAPGAPGSTELSGTNLSLNASSDLVFKVRAFRPNYQDSDVISKTFAADAFVPNSISFGFDSGEASSDFVASPGQLFYAPVTLSIVPGTLMYSLQFNLTVTNAGPNPGPAITPGAFGFRSMLVKPDPANQGIFIGIPPAMFLTTNATPPSVPPSNTTFLYNNSWFENLMFSDDALNLLGVGWLERATQTNLYNTLTQDLIKFSMAHDTVFNEANGKVILGGYAFQVPSSAAPGQTYQIQIARPSATTDGIGAPGATIYINTPTNGSLADGPINSIKIVTAGQRKYLVGDCAPFRWFNAGDFGDTNLDNSDVMQVFQSAIYSFNYPPLGSDFFDSMDSCGAFYVQSPNGYLVKGTAPATVNQLFDGNDTTINQIGFGDGKLDVCDVYVTFRRSLDPSLSLFRRFWTNGVLGAEIVGNPPGPQNTSPVPLGLQTPGTAAPAVHFAAGDFRATAGQTIQIPITAQILGGYPLRVLMLNLSVNPLDGSPALTAPVQFAPNPALGQPTLGTASGNGNYGACWLNSTITGLSSNAVLGTLTVTIPASAGPTASYAISFDHASASPNGLGSFAKTTTTGLITLADRSTSSFNDGIPDSWRLRYFGSIYNMLSQASADADGDGANNWQEYIAGTDPTDVASCLKASTDQAAASQPQDSVIHWPSVSGKTYIIERSPSLFAPTWTPVSTVTGTGTDMEIHDTTGGTVRFYRVRVAQ